MNRRVKKILVAVIAMATAVGITAVAYASWSHDAAVPIPPIALGVVSFDAYGQSEAATPHYSPDGSPVTLTLPAGEILKVLDQTGLHPEPVIWRFTIEGYAQGIAGMNVDITLGHQVGPNGMMTSLDSGIARRGTILGLSTLKVYPAAVNGDCSTVPDTPDGQNLNLHLYEATDHVIQEPGDYAGAVTTHVWCVAMNYNQASDAEYANEVQVIGTGENGIHFAAIDRWGAAVAFPPTLDPLGVYRNLVSVIGSAEDGTVSRAEDVYEAMLYPDPGNEPDVTIILEPRVTNLNPEFSPT